MSQDMRVMRGELRRGVSGVRQSITVTGRLDTYDCISFPLAGRLAKNVGLNNLILA